jgi:hypothetical protein
MNDRPYTLDKLQVQTHPYQGRKNIRKDNGGVEAKFVDWLQSHLGSQFGRPDHFKHGVLGANGQVFSHIATGLTHKPNWGIVGRQAPASTQKGCRRFRFWSSWLDR